MSRRTFIASVTGGNMPMVRAAIHAQTTVAELVAYDRVPSAVKRRNKAMLFLSKAGRGDSEIGRMFGRHPSTIGHGVKRAMEAQA